MTSDDLSGVASDGTLTRQREAALHAFAAAWDTADLDRLMDLMAEECIYQASVGPEPGRTHAGRPAVRTGFEEMLAHDAGAESRGGRIFVAGDLGVMEWSYIQRAADGRMTEVRGCDILEFVGCKIARKDAFRKTWQ
jgi:ketosteroid isomerase-like protein